MNMTGFRTRLALLAVIVVPGVALADIDDLEVTMEVLDSVADINGEVLQMPDASAAAGAGEQASRTDSSDAADDELSDLEAAEIVNDYFAEQEAREKDFEGNDRYVGFVDAEVAEGESNFDDHEDIDDDQPTSNP